MAREEGSKVENIDFRFALVDSEGVERYPYRIKKKDGRFGFVLGNDRFGQGEVVPTVEDVIRGVVLDGKRVRTTDFPPSGSKGSNGLSLASGSEVKGYRIDPTLAHLVKGSKTASLGSPHRQTNPVGATTDPVDWLAKLERLPVQAFSDAFAAVEPSMTDSQREMLRGHVNAPLNELTMSDIAALGGYSDYKAANTQYGGLGRAFAKQMGVDADQLENKVQAICVAAGKRSKDGHFVWQLRPQLVAALRDSGWIEPSLPEASLLEAQGAASEVDADELCKGIPETTRKALVNARIGQGGYRLRMLRLWDNKCAVTGLAVSEALVASHALPWKDSNNQQRLDEYNGLLLSATLDCLFDSGLISFTDAGKLLVNECVDHKQLQACGLSFESQLRKVPERCKTYLQKHRERFKFTVLPDCP